MKMLFAWVFVVGCAAQQSAGTPPVTVNVNNGSGTGSGSGSMTFYQWLDMLNLDLSMSRGTGTTTATGKFVCFIQNAQFEVDGGLVTLTGTGATSEEAMKNYLTLISGKRMTVKDPQSGATSHYTVPTNLQP